LPLLLLSMLNTRRIIDPKLFTKIFCLLNLFYQFIERLEANKFHSSMIIECLVNIRPLKSCRFSKLHRFIVCGLMKMKSKMNFLLISCSLSISLKEKKQELGGEWVFYDKITTFWMFHYWWSVLSTFLKTYVWLSSTLKHSWCSLAYFVIIKLQTEHWFQMLWDLSSLSIKNCCDPI
jgi:hypothetical protein